ncbi:hypothetical protein JL721_1229 [Aureococcus anophagefferens]|nr:hypothetical protein JL721_1229 [Aureococcus anophagefferens]
MEIKEIDGSGQPEYHAAASSCAVTSAAARHGAMGALRSQQRANLLMGWGLCATALTSKRGAKFAAGLLLAQLGGARGEEATNSTETEEGEEEEEEDDELEGNEAIEMKLQCLVVIITVVIFLSLSFEYGRELLYSKTSEHMRPILTSMFGELTTLGFISVTLFGIFKIPAIGDLSGGPAIGLVSLGHYVQIQWREWETQPIERLPKSVVGFSERIAKHNYAVNLCYNHLPTAYRILVYKATRDHFVYHQITSQAGDDAAAKTAAFDFSNYLSVCLGHTIAELVEIPIFTWLFFELLLIFVWVFIRSASHNAGFVRSIVQIHCAEEIRKSLNAQTRRHSIKVYGATTQQRLHEDYPSNFWFGKQTKAGFTLNLVRIIVLCQSVYCAVLMVVFAEQMFESPGHCKAAQAAMLCDTSDATGLVYLALCLVPPFMTISKLPRILEDFTIASNIDSMVNNRMLSNVNRRQKTVAAFEALKVVQCLSDTQMLRQVIDGGSSTGDADCRAKLADREARLAALSKHARKQLEARQRRHWRHVFDIFDDDGSGAVTTAEFRELLTKFSINKVNASQMDIVDGERVFAELISYLDQDGGGTVEFEEFLAFGCKLEGLHGGVRGRRQRRLDKEEFSVLLDRLHIYDTSTLDEVIEDEDVGIVSGLADNLYERLCYCLLPSDPESDGYVKLGDETPLA